jgi:hypothetical protein
VIGKFDPQSNAPAMDSTTESGVATIRGIAVSPGVVTGTARVILHTDVHEQVAPWRDPRCAVYGSCLDTLFHCGSRRGH